MSITVITTAIPERLHMLEENLRCVREQTLQPVEHLVVIDYAKTGGSVTGMNQMLEIAKGDWVAQLADDDVMYPDHLETLAAASADADIVYTYCKVTGRDWNPNAPFDPERLRRENYIPATSLIRTSLLRDLGGWRHDSENGWEDWDFWLRALDAGARFHCVPKVTWEYRFHGSNLSVKAAQQPARTVAVITPWLNHPELAEDYHDALEVGPAPDELIIVDNGSEQPIENAAIRFDHNQGFSAACNAGLDKATADVVVFLNNDVRAFGPGWLARLTDGVQPGVLVGARLRNDPHGAVDGIDLPYLDGWCIAGLREDFLDLGGWDEGYAEPSYYGDNDLSLRARAAGMVLREIQIPLHHKANQTANDMPDRVAESSVANRARFHEVARDLLGLEVAA